MSLHTVAAIGAGILFALQALLLFSKFRSSGSALLRTPNSNFILWLSSIVSFGLLIVLLYPEPAPPPAPQDLGYPIRPHSETTFSALLGKDAEAQGYGLYSYLLFGSEPTDDTTRERYIAALQSISSLQPTSGMLQYNFTRQNLNITYIPLTKPVTIAARPTDRTTAIALLDSYNYTRARVLIDRLNPDLRAGPYIISVSEPLSANASVPQQYLFQDLSAVSPKIVQSWVLIFESESARPNFWEPDQARRFAEDLRSVVDVTAHQIVPNMPSRIAELIGWKDVKQQSNDK